MNQLARGITTGMNQPMGRLLELRYVGIPADPQATTFNSAVRATFKSPDGDIESREYSDGAYSVDNQHLQLMAAIGAKPTEYDNKSLDLRDHNVTVPLVYNDTSDPQMSGWHLTQTIFARGKKALKSADWNEFGDDSAVTVNIGGSNATE